MAKNSHADPIFSQRKPWDDNENTVWLASTVSLFRNIEKYRFPTKLEPERQKQILTLLAKEFLDNPHVSKPQLVHAESMTALQKEFLVEHFLSQKSYHQAHSGEAFILENTGEFLATLNIQDHIHLNLIDSSGEIESMWTKLVAIETHIGKSIAYAYSPKYGFLTSDFTQCGTALNVSVFLQVPALIHMDKIDDVLDKLADDSIMITGIQGNPTEIIGDVLMAQNNYTLGVTEENIIGVLRSFTTKLVVEENSCKNKILQDNNPEMKDKVSRAYGILIHSYQIEAIEALNALSLVKLGLELGWVKGINLKEINQLFLNCRRAHLLHQFKETLKQEEIPHKRAEFIHQHLKNAQLTI